MKRIGGVVLGLALLVTGRAAFAQDSSGLIFSSFHSDITVGTDASIQVTETIVAEFSTPHHGIYRKIPFQFTTTSGAQASIPIVNPSVLQDSQSAIVKTSAAGGWLTLKIGGPDATITGQHVYTVSYTAQAATNFFNDHDELYWNASGDRWDAPVRNISATVYVPGSFASDQIQTACYTGPSGSRATNCQQTRSGTTVEFSADDYLTVVVGWPVGAVSKPANYDELRTQGTTTLSPLLRGWGLVLNAVIFLGALAFMFMRWNMFGRDPGRRKTVIAQYDPPDHLRPTEIFTIMHERAPSKALPATIVDLAVRGYIKIIETEKSRAFGLGHSKEYVLRSLKAPDDALASYERDLLGVLFEEKLFPAADTNLSLSELKKRAYTTDPFAPIFRSIVSKVTDDGYFVSNPSAVRIMYFVAGLVVAGLGGWSLVTRYALPGVLVAGLVVALFSKFMPKRTAKGVEAAWVGHGFKLFLEKAERYRIQWQEREGIFEKFLPYAMVFGVAERWAKALSPVVKAAPSWYQGSTGSAFNAVVFWSTFSNFSTTLSTSTVSAAAGGSSGFGGGFSGGGGGGGGGGGW